MKSTLIAFTIIGFLCFVNSAFGQERCGTVAYEQMIHPPSKTGETESQFENWVREKKLAKSLLKNQNQRTQAGPYQIPVVVHIIHRGEAIGTGVNISDAQIASQIQVMNEDFRRENADRTNTPAEFLPRAGNLDIQFVLARQDPYGAATNGITRRQGSKTTWSMVDDTDLKAQDYWPAENYLNIWVTALAAESGGQTLGYAQLPNSSLVSGLQNFSEDRLTDGVVIHYTVFGKGASYNLLSNFSLGRTTTHEVGHFLGLRHIWGDGSCATDYVDDTPFQTTATTNCPSTVQSSCESAAVIAATPYKAHKMYQDYMDYSYDACMNLYTLDQVSRMQIILDNNSPRRTSLLTSPGLSTPVPAANDLAIRRIVSPTGSNCQNPLIPQLEVLNAGNNVITSAQIQMTVNGVAQTPVNFPSLNLAVGQATTVSFNSVTNINQTIAFTIIQANGVTDGKASNNTGSIQVTVPASASLPIAESFSNSTLPSGWSIANPDNLITWALATAPDGNSANKAMYMNFYDYSDTGTQDRLTTPSFNASVPLMSQLKFDIAYAQYPGETSDNLKVYALPNCISDLSQGVLLYNKSATDLSTATATSSRFIPSSNAQWRKSELLSLNGLVAGTNYQIVFVATNGFGNNLYLDNVVITDQPVNDVALTAITSPGLVTCQTNSPITFLVKNLSTSQITSFQVQATVNDVVRPAVSFSSILLDLGEEKTFSLSGITLNQGSNDISLTVINPNGAADAIAANNTKAARVYIDQSQDIVPLRMTFDNGTESPWLIATPAGAQPWATTSTNKGQSLLYRAFSFTGIDNESWFVSPVLDFSGSIKNGLFFDISYAIRGTAFDRLKVLASTDCGITYSNVLFDRSGSELTSILSTSEWIPTSNSNWTNQFVNLNAFSGKQNVRLAFVAQNKNGNNIYLDNIEIFNNDDPLAIVLPDRYQLYYSTRNSNSDIALTFNLDKRSDVRLQVYSVMGQLIRDNVLTNTLNQTYYFDMSAQSQGLYIFRLQIDEQVSATKVFIGH